MTRHIRFIDQTLRDGQQSWWGMRMPFAISMALAPDLDSAGYDFLAFMVGSEGLLGVVTEVTVRILQKPETARAALVGFPSSEAGGQCVAEIIGAGIIPGGMEMMDELAINFAEDFVNVGYPREAGALLIVELDGPDAEVDYLLSEVEAIARRNGATSLRVSSSEEERLAFWAGRKSAFPAVGRISPDYLCMDGTIPRRALPQVLARMRELSEKHGLRCANVFHAGDGNLHPLILYDANKPGELETVKRNFLIRKLGLKDGPELDEAVASVIETYGRSERNKYRAVVYYMLVKKLGREAAYA